MRLDQSYMMSIPIVPEWHQDKHSLHAEGALERVMLLYCCLFTWKFMEDSIFSGLVTLRSCCEDSKLAQLWRRSQLEGY
uniref:Uncharacterized protein n=1 Tax=Arundo donax TaxID=35708 RepID=A0A0A9EBZ7_ARUDO